MTPSVNVTWVRAMAWSVMTVLALRFGELPEPIEARIRAADAAQIDGWTERVLTAPTLDDALTER